MLPPGFVRPLPSAPPFNPGPSPGWNPFQFTPYPPISNPPVVNPLDWPPKDGGLCAGPLRFLCGNKPQNWGTPPDPNRPDAGKKPETPSGTPVEWNGPQGKPGRLYNIKLRWNVKANLSPDQNPDDINWLLLGRDLENVWGPFDGAYAFHEPEGEAGKFYYGVTRDGKPWVGGYWDPNRQHYSYGTGALMVRVEEVPSEDPDPFPWPPPYGPPPVPPEPLPEPLPQPKPRPKPAPPPLPEPEPQRAPDPNPAPPPLPFPRPEPPKPAPAPAPNPPPSTEPSVGSGGGRVSGKPGLVPVTDKDKVLEGGFGAVGGKAPRETPKAIAKELGRIEQKLALLNPKDGPSLGEILKLLLQVAEAINKIYPEQEYQLIDKCGPEDENGERGNTEPAQIFKYPGGFGFGGLNTKLDLLASLFDAQLGIKQRTCAPKKPELKGQWVTVNFESVTIPSDRRSRLYKRFRYRTESNRSLGELSDYWKDFKWSAGPAITWHQGHSWGKPKCWASDSDEGRRVIGFAAAESGFDPDKVGEWQDSVSSDPRYGRRIEMRVRFVEMFPCVTSRQGPSGLPEVARRTNDF